MSLTPGRRLRLSVLVVLVGGVALLVGGDVGARTRPPPARPVQPAFPASPPGTMVTVAGGTFTMGSDEGHAEEKPPHEVTVATFALDVTEVTGSAYKSCVDSGKCTAPATGGSCNWGRAGLGEHPVNCVDWEQATAYCAFVGRRLPTEEEWEYAARGSAGRTFPWGADAPGSRACWNGEGNTAGKGKRTSTCEVGTHASGDTPEGVKDLAGNVWEWTSSGYSEDYSKNRATDKRVTRGGGWAHPDTVNLRGVRRGRSAPAFRHTALGFRCARAQLLRHPFPSFPFPRRSPQARRVASLRRENAQLARKTVV